MFKLGFLTESSLCRWKFHISNASNMLQPLSCVFVIKLEVYKCMVLSISQLDVVFYVNGQAF